LGLFEISLEGDRVSGGGLWEGLCGRDFPGRVELWLRCDVRDAEASIRTGWSGRDLSKGRSCRSLDIIRGCAACAEPAFCCASGIARNLSIKSRLDRAEFLGASAF
jgi:hypothetical protein